jgi:3-isopropylmalate dehydrogenase
MLDIAFGMQEEANAVISAVDKVLKAGFRTGDIAESSTPKEMILGTDAIGGKVIDYLV